MSLKMRDIAANSDYPGGARVPANRYLNGKRVAQEAVEGINQRLAWTAMRSIGIDAKLTQALGEAISRSCARWHVLGVGPLALGVGLLLGLVASLGKFH
jgi:hypothetical protein